jgi:hypothetical protein
MDNWKKWLIISGVCSLIVGGIGTGMYISSLFHCEPVWYYCEHSFDCEKMGGDCYIVTQNVELWWVIPFCFLVGFALPVITLIIGVIVNIFDWV